MMSEDISSSKVVRQQLPSILAKDLPTLRHGLRMNRNRRWD